MPNNHDSHVTYTNTEWSNEEYFIKVINYLKEKNI